MRSATWILRACLRRDYRIERSYPLAFIVTTFGGLVGLALFFYLSKLVGRSGAANGPLGHGYFPFVVVGLAVSGILDSLLLSIPDRIRQDQLTGALEAVLSTPVRPAVVALGYGAYDLVRATIEAALFVTLAIVVFGMGLELSAERLLAAAGGLAALLVLFAAGGVAAAGLVIAYKRVQGILGPAITGITLLGTVYFPASTLPPVLRAVADANPLTWALALIRPLVTGASVPWDRFALLLGACAIVVPLCLMVVTRGVRSARRRGTLGQY